jgi:ribosomal silencing factor RsfS
MASSICPRRFIANLARRPAATILRARFVSTSLRNLSELESSADFQQLKDAAKRQSNLSTSKLTQSSPLPWYLQVDPPVAPRTTPQHLLEKQKIPELPPNPPPVLEPALKYASVDLGLDYLYLLDLRQMDPPPSLGANQIMIVGTARSEKHMKVSADRLCRWLRSNYKLRPNADGLLGRNELKIKLRRRLKKLRLMANIGATVDEEQFDDGTKQGWICINVTGIEPQATSSTSISTAESRKRFIGFGENSNSVTLVVHILTEQKRGEVDLEGFWKSQLELSQSKTSLEINNEAVS